jgi:IS4 transposase
LVLRLVVVHDGRKAVYLLTSVTSAAVLTDQEIAGIYRWRWGIEVLYRSLKRTMDKHKLRSDSPKRARVELDWAMVGLWLLGLLAAEETMRDGQGPGQWSVALALRAVRRAMQRLEVPTTAGGLFGQLARAVKDGYTRYGRKAARNWPHKKTDHPPGAPIIRTATKLEVRRAKGLRTKEAAG